MIRDSDFSDALMTSTTFIKLTLENINLTSVDLFKSNIKNTDLSSCVLDGIILSENLEELKSNKISALQASKLVTLLGIKIID